MKYKTGDKVLLKAVYTVDTVDERDSERPYVIMDCSGIRIGRYSEEDLSPAVLTPEEATEQFAKDLENGLYEDKGMTKDEMAKLLSGIGKEPQTHNRHQSKIDLDDTGYDEGYKRGYEEAKAEFFENRYQEGLQDAWELAQKIAAMDSFELAKYQFKVSPVLLGTANAVNAISNNTVTEALEKIKACEQEQKLEVGDVVTNKRVNDCVPHIITRISDASYIEVISSDGYCGTWDKENVVKTGKHIDIQSILDQLKE